MSENSIGSAPHALLPQRRCRKQCGQCQKAVAKCPPSRGSAPAAHHSHCLVVLILLKHNDGLKYLNRDKCSRKCISDIYTDLLPSNNNCKLYLTSTVYIRGVIMSIFEVPQYKPQKLPNFAALDTEPKRFSSLILLIR